MKTLLVLFFSFGLIASVQAGDRPFKDFRHIIEDESLSGSEGDYKCQVQTQWLKNGDLKVMATNQYKNMNADPYTAVFSTTKKVDYTIHHAADDYSEYVLEQSTKLPSDPDDPRSLFESFTVIQDEAGTTHVVLSVMEVNEHSDPSEIFHLVCENLER